MRFVLAAAVVGVALLMGGRADAKERSASIGNLWYEEDTQRDRTKIVVDQGDTIRFVVREYDPPSHTVDVEELGISSPDLLLLDDWTTPALDTPGTFRLFCRPHADRGHVTTLIVRAAPSGGSTPSPAVGRTGGRTPEPNGRRDGGPSATPRSTGAPQAPGADPPRDEPDQVAAPASDDDVAAARYAVPEPWTRSVRLLALAVPPVVGVAAVALWLDARRQAGQEAGSRRRRGTGP